MTKFDDNIPWISAQQFQQKFSDGASPYPFGRPDPFKIVRIRDVIGYLKFPLPLHRTGYYDIMFISKGQSSFRHRGLKRYQIEPGQVFFKAAGQITSGDVLGRDIDGFFCLVQDEFFSRSGLTRSPLSGLPFFRYGNSPLITLTPAEQDRFQFLLTGMYENNTANQDGSRNSLIAAYLNTLLQESALIHETQNPTQTCDTPSTPAATSRPPLSAAETLTDKFKDLVAEHYLTRRKVKDYADLLFVTPNHLNKVVRATTGKTALDLISEMLLMEAEILLQQTPMTIAGIAAYLSFDDASYFTRFFRKHKGITPGTYRKPA